MKSKYGALGVDIDKKGIESLKNITDDLYPSSFCSIVKDPYDQKNGIVLHEDGAGSKPIASYLNYRETGNSHWFEPLAQDVIAMNVDDVICVGGIPIAFSDYIALNAAKLDRGELLGGLSRGFKKTFSYLDSIGSKILFSGGETADLPDIIRTFDISGTIYARVELEKIVSGDLISPGDLIVGLRSGGKSSAENKENSGIMCNGISLARHCLLSRTYLDKYPEIAAPEISGYYGRFLLGDEPPELGMTVGEAILSPTRLFLPVARELLKLVPIKAMVHNTGGGLTKCLRLGKNIKYIKDSLPEPDPIFHLIQKESKEDYREMFRNFNMGIGFEVVVAKGNEDAVIHTSEKYGIAAQVIGRCGQSPKGNCVSIISTNGIYNY